MDALILHPWLVLVPVVVLGALWLVSRHRLALWAVAAWLVYLVWEVWLVPETEGDANIRIDLLLIYPALAALTVVAVGQSVVGIWRGRN